MRHQLRVSQQTLFTFGNYLPHHENQSQHDESTAQDPEHGAEQAVSEPQPGTAERKAIKAISSRRAK